jgi:serine/threonine protein kinase
MTRVDEARQPADTQHAQAKSNRRPSEKCNRSTLKDHRSERFGRYQILAELGRGAMGVVYKARDPKINRVVAIKAVSLAGQPPDEQRGYCERFFREAEAAGRLSHPGIVTIFDVGEEPETRAPYIVMEYVSGQSLDKMLPRQAGQLPLGTALQLTQELAEALDCAHGQGVVHRDLKPANILVTEEGHAKIADFGVAKLNLAHLTLPGHVLGTPAYMSPEQLNDKPVDGRSDLFSLGAILYTALTGYRPFQGHSVITVCLKVVSHDPVPATVFDSNLPPGLDYILARAMAKDPAQRYQRGMEMALDIQDLRERREPSSKAKQPGSTPGESTDHGVTPSLSAPAVSIVGEAEGALLVDDTPKKPYVGAAFQGIALLLLVIVVGHAAWHRVMPSKNIAATNTVTTEPSRAELPTRTVAPPTPARVAPASLQIEVEHQFTEATLSIWVDDHLAYTRPLHGTVKKHLVFSRGIQGYRSDAVELAPGKHRVRVRVHSPVKAYDQSKTVAGNFVSGHETVLRINFAKHGEMSVAFQ